jgi:5,6,7,8-tetrahydromethanopterin hydro-lyase
MAKKILFKAGEATVFASEGQYTDAMPEVLIGDVSGPVGQAFANMMAQSKGHTCMFAVRACNYMVRPPTMMATKVTIKDEAYVNLFGGVVQSATADAITDCVAEGVIPKSPVDNLCILCLIWIDPRAPKDPKLDKHELYRNNYEATKLAVKRAMKGEPTVKQLFATRKKVKHDMFDAASGTWY